ncbi:DUF6328 family protein [Streptomyces sudanensis]|nr:DUF6328 family protein [Streptomyces sudanensis]MCP9999605.1 DUF6328 family protein [Streptomyces sudanensis]
MAMTEQSVGWPAAGHPPRGGCPSCAEAAGPDGGRPATGAGPAAPGPAGSPVRPHAALILPAATAGTAPAAGAPQADPPESARDRINRRWHEILQETRVAQTGVQILFGFLLSVAFTPLFRELAAADRAIYVITVVLGALATASLIAPVSLHRFLSGQRMKDEMVDTAHRLMMCGMVLLALTIGCTLLLILHVVVPGLLADLLVGAVMLWFVLSWYVLPLWLRRRSARRLARRSARS